VAQESERIAQKLYTEYVQHATFNSRTGRFQVGRQWTDGAGRQMGHYFDVDAWQRQCQENAKKKMVLKIPKKYRKKYRQPKKRKMPDWLKDD